MVHCNDTHPWPCPPVFADQVNGEIERFPMGSAWVDALVVDMPASVHSFGNFLEQLAHLTHPAELANRGRAAKLAAALRLMLIANRLHNRPDAGSSLQRSESVLLGDLFMSTAFRLLVEIGDMTILKFFSDAAVSMAENDVEVLAGEGVHGSGTSGPHGHADRGLAMLAGAALESVLQLGARLLPACHVGQLGRRLGELHLLLHGRPTRAGEAAALGPDHQRVRALCAEIDMSIGGAFPGGTLVDPAPPELLELEELLAELGIATRWVRTPHAVNAAPAASGRTVSPA